jgi:nitrite reductase (NADH) small subunit
VIVTVAVSDVPADKPLAVRVNDALTLAVCRLDGGFHAFDSKCPHRGAQLAAGELAGELIVCPLHHFKFSLRTGRCVMPKHLKLRSFPVAVEGDQLRIELQVEQDAPRPV